MEGQAAAARKHREEVEEMAARLEGRINRTREHQEQVLSMMRTEQLKFCAEIRSTVTELYTKNHHDGDKGGGKYKPCGVSCDESNTWDEWNRCGATRKKGRRRRSCEG